MAGKAKSLKLNRPKASSVLDLVIDIGNTRTKLFLFHGDRLAHRVAYERLSVPKLRSLFSRHAIGATILSSVTKTDKALLAFLRNQPVFVELNGKTALPFKNRYGTKQTLGNDRIANAAGAAILFPRRNCLVIDTGTCVKYDFMNARNEYLGGAISPGLLMRYQSLHEFTSKLPLIRPAHRVKSLGTSTKESIASGVQQGMLNEMNGFIHWYSTHFTNLSVILTGGDSECFAALFKFPIFAAPELTAIGLHGILQHNQ